MPKITLYNVMGSWTKRRNRTLEVVGSIPISSTDKGYLALAE